MYNKYYANNLTLYFSIDMSTIIYLYPCVSSSRNQHIFLYSKKITNQFFNYSRKYHSRIFQLRKNPSEFDKVSFRFEIWMDISISLNF